MTKNLKIALAQLNPTVGDLDGNIAKARQALAEARRLGADLVVLSELFVTGYPPEDLVLKPAFIDAAKAALEAFAAEVSEDGPAMLIGTPWPNAGATHADHHTGDADVADRRPHNAVALLEGGKVQALRFKADLPNYGVFDEKRVFAPGPMPGPVNFKGVRLGLPICEDIWGTDVVECLSETGAAILISPNGSPFEWKKPDVRLNIAVARVVESGLPLLYLNQVGGQDELVFDGGSFVLNADGKLAVQMPAWREGIVLTEWNKTDDGWVCQDGEKAVVEEGDASAYVACMLGLRDYVDKNGFPGVVLGLSGGVDSALVAALAVDALGPERVHCVMLPYRYTSPELAWLMPPPAPRRSACATTPSPSPNRSKVSSSALQPMFAGRKADTTEENMQSRARGTILMAISNKFGAMVLTTGNKSEMSVGYCTIYGDMNGGFNPIKDLYKMEVYRLCAWRNAHVPAGAKGPGGVVIPVNILTKAPTAELRENQKDQDSLPPYEELDDILVCLVEKEMSLPQIIARGHAADVVKKIERLLYIAEYKRRQAAPGVKISSRGFGRDRRYPITNKFRENLMAAPVEGDRNDRPGQPVKPRSDGGDLF